MKVVLIILACIVLLIILVCVVAFTKWLRFDLAMKKAKLRQNPYANFNDLLNDLDTQSKKKKK